MIISLTFADYDECKYNKGGCSHTCRNNIGSFSCDCPIGFIVDADERTCIGNYDAPVTFLLYSNVIVEKDPFLKNSMKSNFAYNYDALGWHFCNLSQVAVHWIKKPVPLIDCKGRSVNSKAVDEGKSTLIENIFCNWGLCFFHLQISMNAGTWTGWTVNTTVRIRLVVTTAHADEGLLSTWTENTAMVRLLWIRMIFIFLKKLFESASPFLMRFHWNWNRR